MDDKRLLLIWTDILNEYGGKETVDNYKNEYRDLENSQLIKLIDELIITESENKPFRSRAEVRTTKISPTNGETVIYDESDIGYNDLLVSLLTLMFLTNIEDRAQLIVQLAYCLKEMNEDVCERFRLDIAERVYRKYRK